jgi:hypothetical protein
MNDGSHDFDFWIGRWRIRNSRLKERLAASTEWEEFDATGEARFLPGGIGNMDDFVVGEWRPGFVGMTMRLFDPRTKLWSIYWADNVRCVLGPPVVGAFRDGVGIFEGDDEHDGRPVRVRFQWTHETPDTARWQQAFSADGGATWETNWVMNMTREVA